MLKFLKKVKAVNPPFSGPILVHCRYQQAALYHLVPPSCFLFFVYLRKKNRYSSFDSWLCPASSQCRCGPDRHLHRHRRHDRHDARRAEGGRVWLCGQDPRAALAAHPDRRESAAAAVSWSCCCCFSDALKLVAASGQGDTRVSAAPLSPTLRVSEEV